MINVRKSRVSFVDAIRGFALILMIVNHSAIYLLDQTLDPARHVLVYLTVSLSAPLFLFLVGFSLSLSFYRCQTNLLERSPQNYWKYFKRGFLLILSGYLLNIILAPHEPVYSGGILQTIGISVILVTPAISLLQKRIFRDGLLIAALLLYFIFVYSYPVLVELYEQHAIIKHMFFEGFPPWPWISMVLVGLVFGYKWIESEYLTNKEHHYVVQINAIGTTCLLIYFSVNAIQGDIFNFNVSRDYIINGHWLPGGLTIFWVIGMTFIVIGAFHMIFENRESGAQWLVKLGQSAFILYVLQLLIIAGVANQIYGLLIQQWSLFVAFNLALIISFVLLSHRIKSLEKMKHGARS